MTQLTLDQAAARKAAQEAERAKWLYDHAPHGLRLSRYSKLKEARERQLRAELKAEGHRHV